MKEKVLALVAEKTGYPVDMLDLDLDLEADLGVDTVKQAEVFAAIREAYNIPRDENRKLRDFPTLAHVIRFVYEKRPDLAAGPAVAKEEVQPATPKPLWSLRNQQPLRPLRKWLLANPSKNAFSRWWSRRRAIRRTCWIWIWIWKRTSASTP